MTKKRNVQILICVDISDISICSRLFPGHADSMQFSEKSANTGSPTRFHVTISRSAFWSSNSNTFASYFSIRTTRSTESVLTRVPLFCLNTDISSSDSRDLKSLSLSATCDLTIAHTSNMLIAPGCIRVGPLATKCKIGFLVSVLRWWETDLVGRGGDTGRAESNADAVFFGSFDASSGSSSLLTYRAFAKPSSSLSSSMLLSVVGMHAFASTSAIAGPEWPPPPTAMGAAGAIARCFICCAARCCVPDCGKMLPIGGLRFLRTFRVRVWPLESAAHISIGAATLRERTRRDGAG